MALMAKPDLSSKASPGNRADEHLGQFCHLLTNTSVTDSNQQPIELNQALFQAGDEIVTAAQKGVLMLLGNGGSAAITTHMQADLFLNLRARALAFSDTPCLTALSNDFGYSEAYAMQVGTWANEDSLVVAISSSGKSSNILKGVDMAKEKKARVVTFSGFSPDNPLRSKGDLNFYVASDHYGLVEGVHAVLAHTVLDLTKDK